MRRVALTIIVLVLMLSAGRGVAAAQALPQATPLSGLQDQITAAASHAPGMVGIAVRDLGGSSVSSFNAESNMPAASTIKIPVMVEVFRQMALGKVTLDRVVHLQASDKDWGWGDLADAPNGSGYTVQSLLRVMITESDNTATNMLIRLVGRQHINETMEQLGLHRTVVADYIRSDGDIRSLRTSAADMAFLLQQIALERVVDAWSCREMIAILSGQRHNGLLPEPLPRGLQIAHKTGTLHDTLNDVGIVFLGSEPYVIAVMATHLPDLDAGRRFIRSISRLAYDAFARVAQGRAPSGRLPDVGAETDSVGDGPMPPDVEMWTPAAQGHTAKAQAASPG